ncbi:MAG: hypothetical protein AAF550_05145 [Myxococcota bacterium]
MLNDAEVSYPSEDVDSEAQQELIDPSNVDFRQPSACAIVGVHAGPYR